MKRASKADSGPPFKSCPKSSASVTQHNMHMSQQPLTSRLFPLIASSLLE